MNLNEWKDKNGNKINLNSPAASNKTSSGSFKKRLDKLIKYHGQPLPVDVDYLTVNLLTTDTLDFTEHYDDSQVVRYNIYIDPATEAWRLKIYVNNKLQDDISGQVWGELLKTLRPYITVPVGSTPEYVELFTESLNESVKNIPEKLYHATYLPFLDSIKATGLGKTENKMWNDSKAGVVYLSNDPWVAESYAETYEWLDKSGKKINLNNSSSTSSTKKSGDDFTQQFKKLCKHLGDVHGGVKITYLEPHRMSCRVLDRNDLFLIVVKIDYLPESKRFRVSIFANDETQAINIYMQDWEYLLDQFLVAGIIKDKRLCESNSSIADDFKLYENLWEGTEEKEYYKVLGRTKYNLFDDSDLDAYLTQSAKLMRKPAENQKSIEEYKLNKIKFLLYNLTGTKAPAELIQKVQAVQSALENKIKNK